MASTESFSGPRPTWSAAPPGVSRDGEGALAAAEVESSQQADGPRVGDASASEQHVHGGRGGRFLEDLMRAMVATATESKVQAVEQAHTDAKAQTEAIHDRSADEAANLRHGADADVTGIREWSKAEMARIREETDRRIAARKDALAVELDAHAGRIEREIDLVQQQVAAFETEMDEFLARLAAATDPTTMARLAEQMPEPPPFQEAHPPTEALEEAERSAMAEAMIAPTDAPETEAVATEPAATEPEVAEAAAAAEPESPEAESEVEGEAASVGTATLEDGAVEAHAGEAEAPDPEPEADAGAVEPEAVVAEPAVETRPDAAASEAAEPPADAAEPPADQVPDEPVDDAEAALAARLNQLTPASEQHAAASTALAEHAAASPSPAVMTRVSVAGLVSVSGIAAFKRNLARLPGVVNVGVSSSPDGAFVFNVAHEPTLSLQDAIPALPGFGARISQVGQGSLSVTARDPGTES
jgi:hypothetical protein